MLFYSYLIIKLSILDYQLAKTNPAYKSSQARKLQVD
jgi:hypothetical protein